MLFSRREPLDPVTRLRGIVWPQLGWRRAIRYLWLRLGRAQGSPHALAIGVAAGIFAAFVPLIGIQMTLAAGLAWAMRGSLLGAVAGTFVGTPITYPVMWIGSYRLGAWMVGQDSVAARLEAEGLWRALALGSREAIWQAAHLLPKLFKPLLCGGLALGLVSAAGAYYSLVHVLGRLQARRRAGLTAGASLTSRPGAFG